MRIAYVLAGSMAMTGASAMAQNKTPEDQIKEMQQHVALLQQQVALLGAQTTLITSQIGLEAAAATQAAALNKAILEVLEGEANAEFDLGSAQAKVPFAELAGIKAATQGMALPTGKAGTIEVTAGTSGTAFLRSKKPLLALLNAMADDLINVADARSVDTVLVTTEQLESANRAQVVLLTLEEQRARLKGAADKVRSQTPQDASVLSFAAGIAAVYTAGFALDTLNNLGKMLRVDRKAALFPGDAEAAVLLPYLVEAKRTKLALPRPLLGAATVAQSKKLLDRLNELATVIAFGEDSLLLMEKSKEAQQKAIANDATLKLRLPDAGAVADLKAQLSNAKSLADGLNPATKADAFWTQVRGQSLDDDIKQKRRLLLDVKAQVVQISTSRWYWSDKIEATGELQVAYRVLSADGQSLSSGVLLRTSRASDNDLSDLDATRWPE